MSDYTKETFDLEMSSYKTLGSLDLYDIVTTSLISDVIGCIRADLSSKIDTDLAHQTFVHMSGDFNIGTMSISGELSVAGNLLQGNAATTGTSFDGNVSAGTLAAAFNKSVSIGINSFAANQGTAYSKNSAAFGNSKAYGSYSLAHGGLTNSYGYCSHSEGEGSHTGKPEYIGDSSTKQEFGAFAHAEGCYTSALASYSHTEGNHAYAGGNYAHAEGSATSALSEGAHAEGYSTVANGFQSHAEGDLTYTGGQKSHAEGGEVSALGFASHAEGRSTVARASYSHAEGVKSETQQDDIYSYVWQGALLGKPISTISPYESNGAGTFNINPVGGLDGFWIKDHSLGYYLSSLSGTLSTGIDRKLDKYDGGTVSNDVKIKGNFYALDRVLRVESTEEQDEVPSENSVVAEADYVNLNTQDSMVAIEDGLILMSADYVQLCAEKSVEVHSPLLVADKDISAANDIYANHNLNIARSGLIGGVLEELNFLGNDSTKENFAVGHNNTFYGKESFAVHDGNTIGAKGIYWKAIDIEEQKIYLTTDDKYRKYKAANHSGQAVAVDGLGNAFYSADRTKDVPYFGKKSECRSDLSDELFTAEKGINLEAPAGADITIKNYTHFTPFIRCFKVAEVLSGGSVIKYTEADSSNLLSSYYKRTIFRQDNKKGNDSHYIVYFPDNYPSARKSNDTTTEIVSCEISALRGATAFGCAAIGDSNFAGAVNTFAVGNSNLVTGLRSAAIGDSNRISGEYSYAIGVGNVTKPMTHSMALGYGLTTTNRNEIALGNFNKSSSDTAFSLGNGSSSSLRQNAIEIKKDNTICFENSDANHIYIKNDTLCSLFNNVDGKLTSYLDKRTGGTVSGEVEILSSLTVRNSDMNILSGNYILTNDADLSVLNFSYKNAFLQAETATAASWGNFACTGSKGYCMLAFIPEINGIKLSGNISEISSNYDKFYSWAISSDSDSLCILISSISNDNIVILTSSLPDYLKKLSSLTESKLKEMFDDDDNALYCPSNPTIGNAIIHNFYGNHAEGGGIKAIGKYAHAEGRGTIADSRYSHAEGDRTIAGRMAAHAEGQESKAYGKYSHAEGNLTKVSSNATAAHAEGYKSEAIAEGAHAEGGVRDGEGGGTASGKASHAEGLLTKATLDAAHAEGRKTLASGLYSHAEGNLTSAVGTDSHAFGNKTYASGYCSFAGGDAVSATNSEAFAIGWKTYASGQYSFAGGQNTKSTANLSFAFGNTVEANGGSSFASGWKCVADKDNTYAFGLSAIADHKESFVWNAKSNERYVSKGLGTYCINPQDGTNGFYIGISSLNDYLATSLSIAVGDVKTFLKSTLSDITSLTALNNDSEVSDVISATVKMRDMLSALYDLAKD